MNIVAMNVLFSKVKEGNLSAAIIWLKMRAGWHDAIPPKHEDNTQNVQVLLDMIRIRKDDSEKQ